jgi:hypothetical protein
VDDAFADDARHVAEKLKLSYPVLRVGAAARACGVRGRPTLVVPGPPGKARGIFTGRTPALRRDPMRCVAELLDEARKG